MYTVHATGVVSLRIPPGSRHIRVGYGLPEATYTGQVATDGVEFGVTWTDGQRVQKLLARNLVPASNGQDRGAQYLDCDLPQSSREGTLVMTTGCGPNDAMDWSCWAMPEFK
jgi:hypothetical protein